MSNGCVHRINEKFISVFYIREIIKFFKKICKKDNRRFQMDLEASGSLNVSPFRIGEYVVGFDSEDVKDWLLAKVTYKYLQHFLWQRTIMPLFIKVIDITDDMHKVPK